MNFNDKYYQKYLRYRKRYIGLKKLRGGSIDDIRTDLSKDLRRLKFPPGTYKIKIKMLSDDQKNKASICHHYSIFSLYDLPLQDCCNVNSKFFKDIFKPTCGESCEYGTCSEFCNYANSCKINVCSALDKLR